MSVRIGVCVATVRADAIREFLDAWTPYWQADEASRCLVPCPPGYFSRLGDAMVAWAELFESGNSGALQR